MIDPRVGVNSVVAALQGLSDFVSAMGGDPTKIVGYHDSFATSPSIATAIANMIPPSVLVIYRGYVPGDVGQMTTYKHIFTVLMRANYEAATGPDAASGYYEMVKALVDGVSTATVPTGAKMIEATVITNCYSMELPTVDRRTSTEGLDYFEGTLVFPEWGDFS